MFTPFQRALIAVFAVGLAVIGAGVWAKGGAAAPVAAKTGAPASPSVAGNLPPGIVTIGEASVEAPADSAYLAFAVQFGGPVGTDLATGLQQRVDRLLAKARELGVEDKDIVLGPAQFQPQFTYNPQKGQTVNAFNAYQQIAIACDEISGMPQLVQALMKDEATTALSIRYAPSDKGPAYLQARERAIADARAKAETAARVAGIKLGAPISIQDYQPTAPQPYGVATGRFPVVGGPGFPPVSIDTVIRVQVQFAVAPLD